MAKSANPTLKVEHWDIARLAPYPANAKIHPETQVEQIKASMAQFGFVNPILVDAKGEVIAGHGRLTAALEMGFAKVPVIKLGHLTDAQTKALRIADNSIAQAGQWNVDLLEAELATLRAIDYDMEALGLTHIELPEVEEPVAPPPRANRTKTTIFVSVPNASVAKARKAIAAALEKAGINHNL